MWWYVCFLIWWVYLFLYIKKRSKVRRVIFEQLLLWASKRVSLCIPLCTHGLEMVAQSVSSILHLIIQGNADSNRNHNIRRVVQPFWQPIQALPKLRENTTVQLVQLISRFYVVSGSTNISLGQRCQHGFCIMMFRHTGHLHWILVTSGYCENVTRAIVARFIRLEMPHFIRVL